MSLIPRHRAPCGRRPACHTDRDTASGPRACWPWFAGQLAVRVRDGRMDERVCVLVVCVAVCVVLCARLCARVCVRIPRAWCACVLRSVQCSGSCAGECGVLLPVLQAGLCVCAECGAERATYGVTIVLSTVYL